MEDSGEKMADVDVTRKETVEATNDQDLTYDHDDEEPTLHLRTYVVLAAMFVTIFVQVVCLQGPALVLTQIGVALNAPITNSWVLNSLSLVQAVLSPVLASASDAFQARKTLLIAATLLAMVGAGIAPGSRSVGRLIAAQTHIGVGFSSGPITYSITSEIVPHRWRPLSQAFLNCGAALGACCGPLIVGSLTQNNPLGGWRVFYWIQFGLWGFAALGVFFGYRPPKRQGRLTGRPLMDKLRHLDLPGMLLLATGLALLLTGINLGGTLYSWTNVRVLATLVIGIVALLAFGVYEWRGTSTGILHHDLFRGGRNAGVTFALCVALICVEGILLFAYIIFFPIITTSLFETDTLLLAARSQSFWLAAAVSVAFWGWWSSRFRTIRSPLFAGFFLLLAGMVGFATLQPGHSDSSIAFCVVAGLGFSAPLMLLIVGVQLSTPHFLIATASAVIISARAVAAAMFSAIYLSVFTQGMAKKVPSYIARAAMSAGLPENELADFIAAIAAHNQTQLAAIPDLTPGLILAGNRAWQQASADAIRPVFIIAAVFGVIACALCLCLGDLSATMNYRVDAPVEHLDVKGHAQRQEGGHSQV